MTARRVDTNGWIEIQSNPISRVGVFPYSGRVIDPEEKLGLEPGEFYNVFRSEEELANPETMDSFRLLPWTDDHPKKMLGSAAENLIPAEEKGVHGVIGEDIHFDGEFLRANIKVFSQEMADLISSGKKQLSVGYWALYKAKKGEYNGQRYDFIQTDIRGNHLSLVDEGRSGKEVSVLDSKYDDEGFSMKEENMAEKDVVKDAEGEESGLTSRELKSEISEIKALLTKLMAAEKAEMTEDTDEKRDDGDTARDAEEKESQAKDKYGKDGEEAEKTEKESGMDAAEVRKSFFVEAANKAKLADKVSYFIGTFDSASMTLDEVAQYAIRKLGIKCARGEEHAVLKGYLEGAKINRPVATADGLMDYRDSEPVSSQIDAYLNPGSK